MLAGRYQLISHLARGGMADVFEAEDELLQRRVAVKVLHKQYATDDAFVQRFRLEAQRAANLSHPNIVGIYDTGQEESTYFIVMELVEGRTLREVLQSEGALLPRRAAEIAAEVAAALEVAHRGGVIHRDEKPGNIMLTADGSVKVADFGISRAMDDSEELTKTGAVIGTATYFSPEQAQGAPADERSDIYSLGVVLYEMLTGIPPFSGESTVAVAYQHVSEFAHPPSALNHDVPPALDAIVMKAMDKDPAARYQSAAEMRADLLRFLRGELPAGVVAGAVVASGTAETRMVDAPPATVPPDETARHVQYGYDEERRSDNTLLAFGIVGIVVAIAVAAFFLVRIIGGGGSSDNLVTVPQIQGLLADDAFNLLQAEDLKVRPSRQADAAVPEGLVIGSDPPAGTEVEAGSFVTVFISAGPEEFTMKNLIGETQERALELIEADGLIVGEITTRADESAEDGTVLEQFPRSGEAVQPGDSVDLVVSTGPDSFVVPDVENLAVANAKFQLAQAGLTPENVTILEEEEFSDEVLEGFVIRTEPPAGAIVPKGGTVTLFVSTGPGTVEMPLLIGETLANAQATVEDLGLEFRLDPNPVDVLPDSGLDGLVAAQDPQAGTEILLDGTVVVAVGEVPTVIVPNLVTQTEGAARNALAELGLVMEIGGFTPVPAEQVGTVIQQDPAAGTELPIESAVTVLIGEAVPVTTLPPPPPTTAPPP
jgi:serine/threonine-protein kinase